MRAAVRNRFGSPPEVVEVREIDEPVPGPGELLVRVEAAGVNIADWYTVTARPYVGRPAMGLVKPKIERLGTDFAGVVEAVGENVTDFQPGDEVFGGRTGAFAEYVCVRNAVARKPPDVTFEQAAGVPVAGITALQGLRDKGGLEAGQHVVVHGASGGVGTFAVQIAKAFGAEVTGVCSTPNIELVRSLGADHVVDYTREDVTRGAPRYDLVLDIAGTRKWSEWKRVLAPRATFVIVGAPKGGKVLGPLSHVARMRLTSIGSGRKLTFFIARLDRDGLETLAELMASRKVKPVVGRTQPLDEVAEALEHVSEGHVRGKVVIDV
jgi:NADPH:quinone reductase-like Zn-dependent oxidoreductase